MAHFAGGLALLLAPWLVFAMAAAEAALAMVAGAPLGVLALVPPAAAELALALMTRAARVLAALAVAEPARPVARLAAKRPLVATPPARAAVSFVDDNRNLGQFAFSLCINPARGRPGLPGALVAHPRLACVALNSIEYILKHIQYIFNTTEYPSYPVLICRRARCRPRCNKFRNLDPLP